MRDYSSIELWYLWIYTHSTIWHWQTQHTFNETVAKAEAQLHNFISGIVFALPKRAIFFFISCAIQRNSKCSLDQFAFHPVPKPREKNPASTRQHTMCHLVGIRDKRNMNNLLIPFRFSILGSGKSTADNLVIFGAHCTPKPKRTPERNTVRELNAIIMVFDIAGPLNAIHSLWSGHKHSICACIRVRSWEYAFVFKHGFS